MINMNPKYHLLIAVAALSLNACSTDDTCTEREIGGYKISFTVAEDTETRTTLEKLEAGNFMRWVSTDKVGIYTAGQSVNSNIETTADVSKSPVEFAGTLKQTVSSGDMFYAYYPYNAEQQSTNPTAVKLSIPAEQSQTKAGAYNGESNPLVAVPMELSQDWGNAGRINSVRFRQLGAIVELQLYSSNEALCSESISSVTFESETPLAGDITFDLTSVTVKDALPISGYESEVVTTSLEEPAAIPAAKDEAVRVYLTIVPGQYAGKIVVTTNAAQYTFRLKNSMDFKRAAIKGLPADLAKAERIIPDASIHFEDPEVKQICVDNWDTNKNGELSYKEAVEVTDLKEVFKNNQDVNSFNELQYFTGLESIGAYAFNDCVGLTSITIPGTVTAIGNSAFYNCNGLNSITIPDGVTAIGSGAFGDCDSLTSIDIPEGVTTVGEFAFDGCGSLTSINIPDGVTAIEYRVFAGCYGLTNINIPNRVTTIGEQAFLGCYGLTSITIPAGVTTIGKQAFLGCYGLINIQLPDGVTTIGKNAFERCSGLTSIDIPNGVTVIENSVFLDCKSLKNVKIPDGVTVIEDRAFRGCSSLTSIHIPDKVTEIKYETFLSCNNLTSIHLPDGVTTIGNHAFANCSSLINIQLPDGVTVIKSSAFSDCDNLTSINIPKGVTAIEDSAFWDCDNLTSINIPGGVTTIEHRVFYSCDNLTSIQLPDGVTTIENEAFSHCTNLASITIPERVTEIGDGAFEFCESLKSITIPDGVTAIGTNTFIYCRSLTSVYCKPTTPPISVGNGSLFLETPSSLKIYVPEASVDAYKAAEGWSEYASQIFADNN